MTVLTLFIGLSAMGSSFDPLQLPEHRSYPGEIAPDSPHWDLEILYMQGRMTEGLKQAKVANLSAPKDSDLYWHIARFLFVVGEQFDPSDQSIDRDKWYTEMLDWTERGLLLAPGDAHLLFARGIARGRLGTTRGILSSLWMAKGIEDDWLATVQSDYVYSVPTGQEVLPCDAHQALGIFYRLVPESWFVNILAGTQGDIGKSVDHMRLANQCSPDLIRVHKELGVSLLCLGQRRSDQRALAEGRAVLNHGLGLPSRTAMERIDRGHMKMLLDEPSAACGYSRDGQQEIDAAAFEKAQ